MVLHIRNKERGFFFEKNRSLHSREKNGKSGNYFIQYDKNTYYYYSTDSDNYTRRINVG